MATHSSPLVWRIPMDRGAWQAIIHGVAKSDKTERAYTGGGYWAEEQLELHVLWRAQYRATQVEAGRNGEQVGSYCNDPRGYSGVGEDFQLEIYLESGTNRIFGLDSLFFSLKYCWKRQWHPTPVLLHGKSHGQRSLVGCSPWGRKESDMTEQEYIYK